MKIDLITIRVLEGLISVKGVRLTDNIAMTKNGSLYVLTHTKTGAEIYKSKDLYRLIYFFHSVKNFNWEWDDPADPPEDVTHASKELQESVREIAALVKEL